ncbi:Retrovirus-related Pol polyprotein from transposon TNT 1-94 [Phytophthora rubi]|uniref:Retrovirus-related Pol polyprotein from transposon TNT 1-94 n=1 Tax=Phytophthora rubi TaxID=129364 RepID=A0A6A3PCS6_9STRA|nr:Retrovirus-related Pol polyprotein from transposon TNT 1-94 [Phytophthora rubi]
MEQHDQLQLILQLQSELSELKKQLATRAPRAPSTSDTSMETAPPSPKKPKIKDVRCSNFKGNEVYPGLGAGFENFIHEFEHAIRTEELVNGSTWTDDLKASVIVNFLEGKASRYYHKKNLEWQRRHSGGSMPYSDVKRAMRAEFGCKLSQLELSTKMQCNKREGDTWHDYLEYLNFIESLMEGDQTKMVMEVFGNNACPELAPTLLSSVPDDATDYVVETDRMKRLLYKLRAKQCSSFLRNRGILHQETEAGMSSSNGKAERFHRTAMDSARAMLWASALPQRFWGDAVLYASYIRNYLPTRANADHASPIEALSGKRPSVSHILKFGSKCTSHIAHATKRSVKKRAEKGVVIGIDLNKKAYRVLIPRTKRVISTTHIQNIDRLDSRAVGRYMDAVDTDNTDTVEEADKQQHEINTPSDDNGDGAQTGSPAEQHQLTHRAIQRIFGLNRGARALPRDDFRLPQSFLEEFATPASVLLTIVLKEGTAFAVLLERDGIKEPVTVEEAMSSPYWREWWQAIEEELRAISKNATWEVVDIPTDGNVISAKWVFKLKFDNKGELERFKARLVGRGFTQKFGIDFAETFAPVLKIASLRFIVALASLWHAVIRQGDVPNAYLRADLDRPIYMRAPTGLQIPKGKCLLLRKSLYGLKQSGKLWNDTIHRYLLELGFSRSQLDPCLYFRWHEDKLTVLGLYVDDVVVVSQRESDSDWTMRKLADQFQIKDLGPAKKCLGINIEQSDRGIYLHQTANIDGLLTKCGMENGRPVTTPMESTRDLHGEDSEPFYDTSIMRETIGSLLWISNCTRPDITMPVNYLARFVSTPTSTHWTAVKCILRYLRGSRELKLHFPRPQAPRHTIEAAIFSDADWAGGKDAKSTSGGLLTINAMPISWYSKKQSTVALSTAEAEYIAGATTVQVCLWVKQLLTELQLHGKDDNIDLYVDNQSAIKNMENDVTTSRMKHINIKFHFIRDAIRKKEVKVTYCPTTEMKADIFTKPLGTTLHGRNMAMLKLIHPHKEKS